MPSKVPNQNQPADPPEHPPTAKPGLRATQTAAEVMASIMGPPKDEAPAEGGKAEAEVVMDAPILEPAFQEGLSVLDEAFANEKIIGNEAGGWTRQQLVDIDHAITLARISLNAEVARHQAAQSILNPQPMSDPHRQAVERLARLTLIQADINTLIERAQS